MKNYLIIPKKNVLFESDLINIVYQNSPPHTHTLDIFKITEYLLSTRNPTQNIKEYQNFFSFLTSNHMVKATCFQLKNLRGEKIVEELIDDAIIHFSSHAYLINHIFKSKRFLSQIISPFPPFLPYDIHFVTISLYFFLFQLLRHSSIAIKIKTSFYLKTQVCGGLQMADSPHIIL